MMLVWVWFASLFLAFAIGVAIGDDGSAELAHHERMLTEQSDYRMWTN